MKNYINSIIKEITTQYWSIINVSMKLEDLEKIKNEKWYVNFVIAKKKDLWKYGETHYCYENDYMKNQEKKSLTDTLTERNKIDVQDLPF